MTHTATRLRRSGAVAGIGALVASALVLAPAAQAATTVNVTNAEVKPTAADYSPGTRATPTTRPARR